MCSPTIIFTRVVDVDFVVNNASIEYQKMEVQKSYNFTFYRFIKSVYPDIFNFEYVYKSVITKSKKSVAKGDLYMTIERPNSGVYICTVEHVASGRRKSFALDVTFKDKSISLGE